MGFLKSVSLLKVKKVYLVEKKKKKKKETFESKRMKWNVLWIQAKNLKQTT